MRTLTAHFKPQIKGALFDALKEGQPGARIACADSGKCEQRETDQGRQYG